MKVLILNSGLGSRMGVLTTEHPKCMTDISARDTILSRQLRVVKDAGLRDVVITTGYYDNVLKEYCSLLDTGLNIRYIYNPVYSTTNYIYSIYCARELLNDDIILMHGDLVFTKKAFDMVLKSKNSCMAVSSTLPLPEKDFKAVVLDGRVCKVGIEFFDDAYEAQALYNLKKTDWQLWLDNIIKFCENGSCTCYAENAFNEISDKCIIYPMDVKDELCSEIDNADDLKIVSEKLKKVEEIEKLLF